MSEVEQKILDVIGDEVMLYDDFVAKMAQAGMSNQLCRIRNMKRAGLVKMRVSASHEGMTHTIEKGGE